MIYIRSMAMTKTGINSFFHLIFTEETNNTFLQLLRYTFVGGFAFIVDFSLLYLLTNYLNLYYLLSALIAFIAGLLINYFLSIRWVFYRRNVTNRKLEFVIFMVIGIVGLALNELLLWLFTDILLFYYLISKIFTAIFVYLWNFFARKLLLFK
jgi:putative flippase GtrA